MIKFNSHLMSPLCLAIALIMNVACSEQKNETNMNKPLDAIEQKNIPTCKKPNVSSSYYDEVFCLNHGLAMVRLAEKYHIVDADGKIVVYHIKNFNPSGLASIEKDKKWGLVHKSGKILLPIEYDAIGKIGDLTKVTKGKKYGLVNKEGQLILPAEYDSFKITINRNIIIEKDGKYGFIYRESHIIIPAIYEHMMYPSNEKSLIGVKKEGKWGFIDKNNR